MTNPAKMNTIKSLMENKNMVVNSDGWQTLDSAPRDGTMVYLTVLVQGKPEEIIPMQWNPTATNELFPGIIGMWVMPDNSEIGYCMTWQDQADGAPTHWKPVQPVLH